MKTTKYVLDASAVIALLKNEPGAKKIEHILPEAYISAVNVAEIVAVLTSRLNRPKEEIEYLIKNILGNIVPFTDTQAIICGTLIEQTKSLGLSLGDRACLTLGMDLGATTYTTDQAWKQLKIKNLKIVVIR